MVPKGGYSVMGPEDDREVSQDIKMAIYIYTWSADSFSSKHKIKKNNGHQNHREKV